MFDALDEFLMKMQEASWKFSIFPYNLSLYGLLENVPLAIGDPETLPTEVDDMAGLLSSSKTPVPGGQCIYNNAYWNKHPIGKNHEVAKQLVYRSRFSCLTNNINKDWLKWEI